MCSATFAPKCSKRYLTLQRKGIYLVSLNFDFDRLIADRPPEPGVSVCRLSKFDNDRLLSLLSCLQITHDAIYLTYKPLRGLDASDTAHHEHVHDVGDHDAAEEAFPIVDDDMEDGFMDGWEDEDSEDEDLAGIVVGADGQYSGHFLLLVVLMRLLDPLHAIINNWFLPTSTNTVYSVSF